MGQTTMHLRNARIGHFPVRTTHFALAPASVCFLPVLLATISAAVPCLYWP
uniref:Uncharacterized protein n=1 Tax=Picea sitchensis TaxID=3332 RepID=A0A6B9XP86_PICSI|nr:hypothetical protein Q903MT_gene3792 [Picea sitchensis]